MTITIKYNASVKVDAGFRRVEITARAYPDSKGMATVVEVTAIDGEVPNYGMSRTGARRQQFNGRYVAQREQGARKRLSACELVEA